MYRLKEKLDVQIIAYCIMNNHAHILIKTNNIHELGKYMQCLNTKYGKYYNKNTIELVMCLEIDINQKEYIVKNNCIIAYSIYTIIQ